MGNINYVHYFDTFSLYIVATLVHVIKQTFGLQPCGPMLSHKVPMGPKLHILLVLEPKSQASLLLRILVGHATPEGRKDSGF